MNKSDFINSAMWKAQFFAALDDNVAFPAESRGFSISQGTLDRYYGTDEAIIIPEEVMHIGACWSLEDITFQQKTIEIADSAFYGCKNLDKNLLPR